MTATTEPKPIVGRYLSGFCDSGEHSRCPVSVTTPSGVYLCADRCHPGQRGLKKPLKGSR